jgi:hypothetical protein
MKLHITISIITAFGMSTFLPGTFGQALEKVQPVPDISHYKVPVQGVLTSAPVNTNQTISLPQKQNFYSWADTISDWQLRYYSEMSYLENGKIDTMTNFLSEGSDPKTRSIDIYDAEGRIEELIVQTYNDGWQYTSKNDYAYDQHGNLITELNYIWFNGNWSQISGTRNEYTYSGDDFLVETLRQNYNFISGWYNSFRQTYNFDGGTSPIEIIMQDWGSSSWINTQRMVDLDIKEYDAEHGAGIYNSYSMEKWDGFNWVSDLHYDYTFSPEYPAGGYSYIEQIYREGAWMDSIQYSSIYGDNGLISEVKTETWLGGQWVETEGNRYFYTIQDIDLLELIAQFWDSTSTYVNDTKIIYSDFLHIEGVQENAENQVAVYPNPASKWIRVDLKDPEWRGIVSIVDITGRKMKKVAFDGSNLMIPVGDLPDGLYFLRIEGNHAVMEASFIKH